MFINTLIDVEHYYHMYLKFHCCSLTSKCIVLYSLVNFETCVFLVNILKKKCSLLLILSILYDIVLCSHWEKYLLHLDLEF